MIFGLRRENEFPCWDCFLCKILNKYFLIKHLLTCWSLKEEFLLKPFHGRYIPVNSSARRCVLKCDSDWSTWFYHFLNELCWIPSLKSFLVSKFRLCYWARVLSNPVWDVKHFVHVVKLLPAGNHFPELGHLWASGCCVLPGFQQGWEMCLVAL